MGWLSVFFKTKAHMFYANKWRVESVPTTKGEYLLKNILFLYVCRSLKRTYLKMKQAQFLIKA